MSGDMSSATGLSVWCNGPDYVIAADEADARAVWTAACGDDDEACEGDGWRQMPDDLPLSITEDDGRGTVRTRSYVEWAGDGRGFLCSENY